MLNERLGDYDSPSDAAAPGDAAAAGVPIAADNGSLSDWVRAHEALSRLARNRAAADAEEGRWLLAALRSSVHSHLGFGSFSEYVERLFGYKARSAQEKLRVAQALEALPATAQALGEGLLHWSAARELTRVAVLATEREWLEVAREKAVHELEALVAGKRPGDSPSSPSHLAERRHVLRLDVAAETFAAFREAAGELRRRSDRSLDDDAVLMLMARSVLGGPASEGRAAYQIALSVCPECGKGSQLANGELVPVSAEVVAMADCDGQGLGVAATPRRVPVERRAHVGASSRVGTGAVGVAEGELGMETHVGASSRIGAEAPGAGRRATQTIPPKTRRAVLHRDHRCCVVPGCRSARYLDVHHIVLRSEGGGSEMKNLVTLCAAHHRAVHRGELRILGNGSAGASFRHADGSSYGQMAEPRVIEAQAKAFAALRGLGFREGETRRTLAQIWKTGGARDASTESVLREALAMLTAPRRSA